MWTKFIYLIPARIIGALLHLKVNALLYIFVELRKTRLLPNAEFVGVSFEEKIDFLIQIDPLGLLFP